MTSLGRLGGQVINRVGRILGIDVGERRIGLAISAPEGRLAVPLRVLEASGDDSDARAISDIARDEGVEALVVGLPRSLDGSRGPQARRIEEFARRLAEVSGLPLELWDERLSSVQARRSPAGGKERPSAGSRRAGGSRRRRRAPIDDTAAAIILESYLQRHRTETDPADQ